MVVVVVVLVVVVVVVVAVVVAAAAAAAASVAVFFRERHVYDVFGRVLRNELFGDGWCVTFCRPTTPPNASPTVPKHRT